MNLSEHRPVSLSIGIMAWNEADGIGRTLESLFQQSVFERLALRHERCEILCLANGCTDRTVPVTEEFFGEVRRRHPWRETFDAQVRDIAEPGRNNAWNRFVHEFSAPESRFLCLMDADIVFRNPNTLHSLMTTLERNPRAGVAAGRQCKDIQFKARPTLRDRLSLATSAMTATIEGRFSGQLYCLRAGVARNLLLPRDLGATDDGFMKAIVCTNFLTSAPDPNRIATAPEAAHVFEAYVSPRDVLNNQKRQMIGQTTVHVLLEYLKTRSFDERTNLADTLREHENRDPEWLAKKIDAHIHRTRFFWRLFPGILTFRFRRLWKLPGWRKLTHLPAALAGFGVTLIACWRAHRFLRRGMSQYWPKVRRQPVVGAPQPSVK